MSACPEYVTSVLKLLEQIRHDDATMDPVWARKMAAASEGIIGCVAEDGASRGPGPSLEVRACLRAAGCTPATEMFTRRMVCGPHARPRANC